MKDIYKAYADATADMFTEYARQLTAEDGTEATVELLKRIGSGSERVVLVTTLVPFSVAACRLDDVGKPDVELFKVTDGGLH